MYKFPPLWKELFDQKKINMSNNYNLISKKLFKIIKLPLPSLKMNGVDRQIQLEIKQF